MAKERSIKTSQNCIKINGLKFNADRNTLSMYERNKKKTIKDMITKFRDVKFKMIESEFIGNQGDTIIKTCFTQDGSFNLDTIKIDCESTLSKLSTEHKELFLKEISNVVNALSQISGERTKRMMSDFSEIFNIDMNAIEESTADINDGEEVTEKQVKDLLSKLAS